MKKLFLSFIVMVLSTITINAQVGIADMTFEPGETKVLAVTFGDATGYTAFQMDIELPAGFSIATTLNEDDEEVLDITIDDARKKSTHQLSYNEIANNVFRMAAFSSKNATFKGTTEAPFVNIGITASADIAPGSYAVKLTNVAFTTPTPEDIKFDDVTATFTIPGAVVPDEFTATVNCAPEGDAMLSATVVTSGSPLKLLIAPNNGYKVATLTLNGNAVEVENNVYNIEAVAENVAFDVTFEAVVPDTVVVEVEKVVTDTLVVTDTVEVEKVIVDTLVVVDTVEVEKIVVDTLVVEKIVTDTVIVDNIITDTVIVEKVVTDTVIVEKVVTDTIEIETIETDTIYISNIDELPAPEISFADGMMSLSCVVPGVRMFYSLDGTVTPSSIKEYSAPVAISDDCTVMAIAVAISDVASKEIIGTGIGGGVADEIVSCQYFTEAGVEIDEPREGINIMVVKYASGKVETKKVIVRKK